MFGIGIPEALIIIALILIIFGAGKLPEIGSVLGRSIASVRKATRRKDDIESKPTAEQEIEEKKP
jgi:sec-independent protein translocase protein TatA